MPQAALKVQVWIYRLTDDGPRFLILRLTPKRGGYWQPVTGNLDPGESLAECAVREALEETGLTGTLTDLNCTHRFPVPEHRRDRLNADTYEEHAFGLLTDSDTVTLDGKEHDACKWVTADEARAALRWEQNREALDILIGKIT